MSGRLHVHRQSPSGLPVEGLLLTLDHGAGVRRLLHGWLLPRIGIHADLSPGYGSVQAVRIRGLRIHLRGWHGAHTVLLEPRPLLTRQALLCNGLGLLGVGPVVVGRLGHQKE